MTLKNAKSLSTTVRATHAVLLLQSGSLISHETRCCRGVNVIAAESCGVTKLRWVRGVMVVMRIAQKRVEYRGEGVFLILHALWKRRYYQPRSRRVNSPQEHRNAHEVATGRDTTGRATLLEELEFLAPGQYIKRIIKHWKPRRLPVSRSFMFIATSSFASLSCGSIQPAERALSLALSVSRKNRVVHRD